jgi:hypothetical protein
VGVISPAYREERLKLFRFKGWFRSEPGYSHPGETAHVFEQLVFHALAEDYSSESNAAELMNQRWPFNLSLVFVAVFSMAVPPPFMSCPIPAIVLHPTSESIPKATTASIALCIFVLRNL